jgi:hypothetical protein
MVKKYPTVNAEYHKAIEKAKRKLRSLIAEKNCAPIMLRLAYNLSLSTICTMEFVFCTTANQTNKTSENANRSSEIVDSLCICVFKCVK